MAELSSNQSSSPSPHFLIVSLPVQSHINPARHLAYRLSSLLPSCHVSISTAISAHRRMFPSLTSPDQETTDRHVSFAPYSDGYNSGFDPSIHSYEENKIKAITIPPKCLNDILSRFKAKNRPVTCIIHTLFLSWVHDVARLNGLPTALYWIQPATTLALYHHYFHGFDSIISSRKTDQDFIVSLPGLIPLTIEDLPSFLLAESSNDRSRNILNMFRETFEMLDVQAVNSNTDSKPRILINTFEALEADVLKSMEKHFELYTVGPLIQSSHSKDKETKNSDMFEQVEEPQYMKWLDTKPESSVVYISFGSFTQVAIEQLEEVKLGLQDSGLTYLWVVRKDSRVGLDLKQEDGSKSNGMIIEWCDQVMVLSHKSIGCFLTHFGWNSTLESMMCGVPMVGVPQWSDQSINAKLIEETRIGVRAKVCEGLGFSRGIVKGGEIKRCLEMVMKDCERGLEIRRNACVWREKVREAMKNGGGSEINLINFVKKCNI